LSKSDQGRRGNLNLPPRSAGRRG